MVYEINCTSCFLDMFQKAICRMIWWNIFKFPITNCIGFQTILDTTFSSGFRISIFHTPNEISKYRIWNAGIYRLENVQYATVALQLNRTFIVYWLIFRLRAKYFYKKLFSNFIIFFDENFSRTVILWCGILIIGYMSIILGRFNVISWRHSEFCSWKNRNKLF